MIPVNVYIGFDQQETIAYHVLSQSILRHASGPVSITPIIKSQLGDLYTRKKGPTESTDFSMTRFLVPYLSRYEGYSIFMDCDMLAKCSIHETLLYAIAYPDKAVTVCQHDYVPKTDTKFLGQQQTAYPRKNWSSLMVFNNARCKALTPEYVNTATGLDLHRFNWCKDEEIGAMPLEFNWLVGEYEKNDQAKILHYTLGTPCFEAYGRCDHAQEWFDELNRLMVPMKQLVVA